MSSLFLFVQVQLGSLGAKFVLPVCCFVCLHQSFMVDHGWLAMDGACMVDHQWSTMHSCTKHNIHIHGMLKSGGGRACAKPTPHWLCWLRGGKTWAKPTPPVALLTVDDMKLSINRPLAARGQIVGQTHPPLALLAVRGQNVGHAQPPIGFAGAQ